MVSKKLVFIVIVIKVDKISHDEMDMLMFKTGLFDVLDESYEISHPSRSPSSLEKDLGCWIDRRGKAWQKPEKTSLRVLNCYAFVLVKRGNGQFLMESTKVQQVKEGDLLFIDAETPHYYDSMDEPWLIEWLVFDGPLVRTLLKHQIFDREKVILSNAQNWFLPKLHELQSIHASPKHDLQNFAILIDLLHLWIKHRDAKDKSESGDKRSDFANMAKSEEALQIINREFMTDVSPEEIARRVQISYSHLRQSFKKQYGKSMKGHLLSLRLQKAKAMLIDENLPIAEVSLACGFGDPFYFMRIFKKELGMTPKCFRQKHRERSVTNRI